ncbi:MAG: hypothetical protein J7J85_03680 [Deltaproteobacteria bacterium]|nr:hypothetical protein [Deltaproteobacteria bacterium]
MFLSSRKRILRDMVMLILIFSLSASACYAGALRKALEKWRPAGLRGLIMEVSHGGHYIIVNEKKVVLVNTHLNKRTYKTQVMDIDGRKLGWGALTKGREVLVKGSAVFTKGDGIEILAKYIYILPRRTTRSQGVKVKEILSRAPTPW